jgi:hypothetical protein
MMGKEPSNHMKYEELKAEIESMRKKADVGMAPTKVLEVSVDFENIVDLELLKDYAKNIGVPGYQAYKSVAALKEKIRTLQSN